MEDIIIQPYKFPLIGVVKYAKNHLKRTDSIWYDMACCVWNDGQGYGPFYSYTEDDEYTPQQRCYWERKNICLLIITKIEKVIRNEHIKQQIIEHTAPENGWKIGYSTRGNSPWIKEPLPQWEYWEAVLRAHLSVLAHCTYGDLGYENWDEFHAYIVPELIKDDIKES